MIVFDVGDDGTVRTQAEEHMVIFVRFDDEVVASAGTAVAVPLRQHAAQNDRRVLPGFQQYLGDHGRGRGLAMRSGDGDADLSGHQYAQEISALEHRYAIGPRSDQLRIVGRDGRRHDNGRARRRYFQLCDR